MKRWFNLLSTLAGQWMVFFAAAFTVKAVYVFVEEGWFAIATVFVIATGALWSITAMSWGVFTDLLKTVTKPNKWRTEVPEYNFVIQATSWVLYGLTIGLASEKTIYTAFTSF